MNRNKEVIIRICLLVSLCSIASNMGSILHKGNNYNEDKFVYKQGITATAGKVDKTDYGVFMENVKQSEIRIAIEKEIIRVEKERLKQEKILIAKKKADKEKARKLSISRGGNIEYNTTFELTFYDSLDGVIMSSGKRVYNGACASNTFKNGTKIMLKGFGSITVNDCGGSDLNVSNRLDIFIGRNQGESEYQYRKRVFKMGRIHIRGYIIK